MWQWYPRGSHGETAVTGTRRAEPWGPQPSSWRWEDQSEFPWIPANGSQVPAEDLRGRMPHPWGCKERGL